MLMLMKLKMESQHKKMDKEDKEHKVYYHFVAAKYEF